MGLKELLSEMVIVLGVIFAFKLLFCKDMQLIKFFSAHSFYVFVMVLFWITYSVSMDKIYNSYRTLRFAPSYPTHDNCS